MNVGQRKRDRKKDQTKKTRNKRDFPTAVKHTDTHTHINRHEDDDFKETAGAK